MKRKFSLLAAVAALSVVAAGCGSYENSSSSSGAPYDYAMAPGAPESTGPAAKVGIANSPLGPIVVDSEGRTLYLFDNDKGAGSTCNDVCANSWPPVTTNAKPTAANRVLARHLSTTRRENGKLAVTYAGHPLYRYAGDSKRGDTKGDAISRFGAEWHVVAASGTRIDLVDSGRR